MFHPDQYLAKLIPLLAFGTLCGCTDEPVFEKIFSTDHFDYYLEQGATPPCDATGEWLERYYEANAKFLGAELPAGQKIEYYFLWKDETVVSECGDGLAGCTKETKIYMGSPINAHEIVHASAFLLGDPPRLFAEGLADVIGCASRIDSLGPIDVSAPIENLLETSSFVDWFQIQGPDVYSASASFVRYLIDTFGAAKFLAFYARGQRDASCAETKDIFAKEMGVALDDVLADWRKLPPPLPGDLCLRLMECDPSMKMLMSNDVDLECGPWAPNAVDSEALFRFQVNADRMTVLNTTPEISEPQPVSNIELYSCTNGSVMITREHTANFLLDMNFHLSVDPTGPTRSLVVDVPPGEYVAWFKATNETTIHLETNESLSPMRNACMAAPEPLLLHDNVMTLLTSRWMDRPCSGFWCPGRSWDIAIGPTGGTIAIQAHIINDSASPTPDKVYVCSNPCPTDTNQCETLSSDPSTGKPAQSKQVFAPGTIVHIGAPLAPLNDHFSLFMRIIPPCNGRVPCSDSWHGPR